MKTPMQEHIEECKGSILLLYIAFQTHLRDNTTHDQQYKTDIRKLITALERVLNLINTKEND